MVVVEVVVDGNSRACIFKVETIEFAGVLCVLVTLLVDWGIFYDQLTSLYKAGTEGQGLTNYANYLLTKEYSIIEPFLQE